MSHGQTGRLAINANSTIINTKVLNCGVGEIAGNAVAVESNIVPNNPAGKVTLKFNSKPINNDVRYATVTITPSATSSSQNAKVANNVTPTAINATIHHSAPPSGGQLIHLIPLKVGNVTTTTTAAISTTKAQQIANDMPLTIITKSNYANTHQNSLIGSVEEVIESEKIIAATLSNNGGATDPLSIATLNIAPSIAVSKPLANTMFPTNMSARQSAFPACSINSVINGSTAIMLKTPKPKTTATFQRPIALGGIASIISTDNAVNGNVPNPTGKLSKPPLQSPSVTTQITENNNERQTMENKSKNCELPTSLPITNELNKSLPSLPTSEPHELQSLIMIDEDPSFASASVTSITALVSSNVESGSCHTIIDTSPTTADNNNLNEIITECIVPTNASAADFIKDDVNNSNLPDESLVDEEYRSEETLIIDDSTDDEFEENKKFDAKKSANAHSSPITFTHISKSVVLTKAKAVDNKANGGSRNLSPEPANVVLMKLPNASKQPTGNNDLSLEIPITEALTLAVNADSSKTNTVKIISVSKKLDSPSKKHPPTFMRSNSIPNTSQSLSPRATKRCQSLNYGQPANLTPGLHQKTSSKDMESPEKRQQSNSMKSQMQANNGSFNNITDENDVSSSSDELNKENNDVTFIELDDSFGEEFSEESNASGEAIKNEQNNLKISREEKPLKNSHEDFQIESSLLEKPSTGVTITKDQNANTKILPTVLNLQSSLDLQKQRKHSISVSITKSISGKNENDEQIMKSLLCNENMTEVTPSSSTSVSSTQDPAPAPEINHTQSQTRPALTPRVRDHNRIIDANAATARRICRDSSIASALSMVSTFDMLNWKEDRIASARGTTMRFELNEFNLLQVHERGCPPRYRIHTPYERPIYERFSSMPKTDQADPLLYICRTCKLYGPAVDFLAPEFCSVECLKRTFGKRSSRDTDILDNIDKKRLRKNAPTSAITKSFVTSTTPKQAPVFRWSTYLSNMRNAIAAPIDLFLNPFPTGPNPFQVGMKVEAIDPENCSLFCVCTIVQIQGYRLRLNFDGYNSVYDFWVNADSMDIFPPGWCGKTNRILQPPRGYEPHKFDWSNYLRKTNSIGADKKFFTHLNTSSMTNRNPFTIGMFLEADDLNDTGKLCVASVADILDERIRVHFDGWDDCYDYWVDISSPYIHPCGWHEGRQQLLVPPEYSNTSFTWRDYIRESQGLAAPTDFFLTRDPIDYRPGMKLEVVDPRNPSLIRPATVIHRTRHRVKIQFDCWPPEYTFCLEDDSPDLHPIGWCDATGHELEPPPTFHQQPKIMPCNTIGCRGLGNMDRSNGLTHANREFCPYILENWRSKPEKKPRVDGKDIVRKIRQESTSTSLLKDIKRQYNQIGNAIELPKAKVKPAAMPYKQATRGRPRNCDRLAAAAAAAAAAAEQEEQQKHLSRQNILSAEAIKVEKEDEISTNQIEKDASALDNRRAETARKLSLLPTASAASGLESKIMIAKQFLCDYGPRLHQNYILWRQNAGVDVASKVQRNPLLWSTAETCSFIDAVLSECLSTTARYAVSSKFYNHNIDGAALLMLQQRDLTDILEFKIGPAVKLCSIILQLRLIVVSQYGSSVATAEVDGQIESLKNNSDFPK